MRAIQLLPLLLFLAACGTADGSRLLERDRQIEVGMKERYDFGALGRFLRQVIAEHPVSEKIDLRSTEIKEEWHIERVDPPARMRSGDWVIWDARQGKEEFDLYFTFDPKRGRSISIRGKRLTRDQFQLIDITLAEWVELGPRK